MGIWSNLGLNVDSQNICNFFALFNASINTLFITIHAKSPIFEDKIFNMKKTIMTFLFAAISLATFAQEGDYAGKTTNAGYGKNIISFNPVHLIASNFVGVGFGYERLVNEYLGLKVPVMLAVNNNYFNIGLEAKLYPAKNNGPVKYAVAPMIMAGIGENKEERYTYDQFGNYVRYDVIEKASHFGFLLNQTLNVTISRQFWIGLDGGLGINYYDERATSRNNSNLSFVAQFQIGMGYRF